jgi:hypothetical protein
MVLACIAFNLSVPHTGSWAAEGTEELYKKGRAAFDAGDIVGAMPLLKKAADAGHPKAQAAYAYLLDESDYDTEAATYYKLAADQGDPDGYFGLAGLHINGHAGLAQDNTIILGLLEKSARGGHPQAIISLATAYIGGGLGLEGAALSSPAALDWIRKAADLGDIAANEALRDAYQNGRFGLAVDPGRASELDKKIAKLKGIEQDTTSKKKRRSRL